MVVRETLQAMSLQMSDPRPARLVLTPQFDGG
jgi:hypothetical protein